MVVLKKMNLISKDDKFALFGSKGMAGSAISRSLKKWIFKTFGAS